MSEVEKKPRKKRTRSTDMSRTFIASGGHCFVKETVQNNITRETVECLRPLPKMTAPKDVSLSFSDPRGFKILSFLGINMTQLPEVYDGKSASFNGLPIRKINLRGGGRPSKRISKAGSEKIAPVVPGQSLKDKFQVEQTPEDKEVEKVFLSEVTNPAPATTIKNPFKPEPAPIAELSFETPSTVEVEKPVMKPGPKLEFEFD